jgi:hypothetical protein
VSLNGGYTAVAAWSHLAHGASGAYASVTILDSNNSSVAHAEGNINQPSNIQMTVTSNNVYAFGLTVVAPITFSSANNPVLQAHASFGGTPIWDNLYATSDLTGASTPIFSDGFTPFNGSSITLTQTAPDANSQVVLTATADQDVSNTPYFIYIQDSQSGGYNASCATGTVCQATVNASGIGSISYTATIDNSSQTDLQATSNTIIVNPPARQDVWGITLTQTPYSKASTLLTANVSPDSQASQTVLLIWQGDPTDPGNAAIVGTCYDVTCTSIVPNYSGLSYYATAGFIAWNNAQVTSGAVSLPVLGTSTDHSWTVSLAQSDPSDGQITLTATSNQDVSLVPYYIYIMAVGPDYDTIISACYSGNTCQATVSSTTAGGYYAVVSGNNYGSEAIATSATIAITP